MTLRSVPRADLLPDRQRGDLAEIHASSACCMPSWSSIKQVVVVDPARPPRRSRTHVSVSLLSDCSTTPIINTVARASVERSRTIPLIEFVTSSANGCFGIQASGAFARILLGLLALRHHARRRRHAESPLPRRLPRPGRVRGASGGGISRGSAQPVRPHQPLGGRAHERRVGAPRGVIPGC